MAAQFTQNNKLTKLYLGFLALGIALVVFPAATAEPKETNLILYIQDFAKGPNPTLIPVAGIAGKLWTFTQFGTVYVTDDPITDGPGLNSTTVGRAQGIYVTTGLDGRNLLVLLSLVFSENSKYKGSSIELQGTSKQFEEIRELGVVSGTGKFRMVRGFATGKNVFMDIPKGYTVIQFNVTLKHY